MIYPTAIALLGATAAAAQFAIAEVYPPPSQCRPANITWVGGTPPYVLTANPPGLPNAGPLTVLTNATSDHAYTWVVDLPQGTGFDLRLTDASGVQVFSMPYKVRNGTSDCAVNQQAAAAISSAQASASSARAEATSGAAAAASPSASHPSRAMAVAVPGLAVAAAALAAAVAL
ncbi:uncharacterized protein LOC62_01G000370 [Vanrija pseudolonga]|uniref:Uncharacterized protein n=1 Tax=Vanrija pseudolonga TaxID=143232 RepID=A0AAF0XZD0_9TREE|nr:hypothetical protein LOC62_01G000370 [Vanrija pseudolonga]